MPERSATTFFPYTGRRRSRPRRRRRFQYCSTFGRRGPVGYDLQAQPVSRSCRSSPPNRPEDRRPRHRTGHDVPPPRLPYVSTSALPTSVDLLLLRNGPAVVWVLGGIRSRSTGSTIHSVVAIVWEVDTRIWRASPTP